MSSPDDLPRSPTGRVPQWVIDEATGKAQPPEPWRAPSAPLQLTPPKAPRSSRRQSVIAIVILLALAGAPRLLNTDLVSRWLPGSQAAPEVVSVVAADGSVTLVSRDTVWPTPDLSTSTKRLLPQVRGTAGIYKLLDKSDATSVGARWSPCRPIALVVNTTGAPKGFYASVGVVAQELQAYSGLVINVEGTSAEPASSSRASYLPDSYGDRWAPVLIAWADDTTIPGLAGDIVGLASPYSVSVQGAERYYVSGHVILDTTLKGEAMPDGSPAYVSVLRHEMGHVLGLDHVKDVTQLMAPRMTTVVDFADGDRAGLAALGSGPCSSGI